MADRVIEILKLVRDILDNKTVNDIDDNNSSDEELKKFKRNIGKQPTLRYQSSKFGK